MDKKCNCVAQTKPPTIRVIDSHHRVGGNIPLLSTMHDTLSQIAGSGSHCVQFFLGPRQQYRVRKLDKKDIDISKRYCEDWGKTFYIHCPYVANLSKDPKSKDPKEKSIFDKSVQAVTSEIEQINGLPGSCVLHAGSKGSINNLVNNLNNMQIPRNTHIDQKKLLCIENSCGSGSNLARDFTEMRKLYEGIDQNTIGLCIDTQHIFSAGVNRLETHEDVVKLFDDIEGVYGKPDVIHLNDSKKIFGARVDRHENVGSGYIWSHQDEGLRTILDLCYDQDIDCILETPDTFHDINLIRTKYMDLNTIDSFTTI